jgi:membrane-associated phospholipid phosphatase
MKSFKNIIQNNLWFFVPYLLVLLFALFQVAYEDKGDSIKWLDMYANKTLDLIFVTLTDLGDGLTASLLALGLLFVQTRKFIGAAVALILSLIAIAMGKGVIWHDWERPRKFFESLHQFREIEGLNYHFMHPMPSGHTTAAFCIFSFLAFVSIKKTHGYMFFLIAFTVAFSRMYLAQHFLEDVVVGSLLGVLFSMFSYYIFCQSPLLQNKKWANQPLIKL